MILVRLTGGLGNQMFQMANSVSKSIELEKKLYIDTTLLGGNNSSNKSHITRYYDLDIFNLPYEIANKKQCELFNLPFNASIFKKIIFKLNPFKGENIIQKGHANISLNYSKSKLCFIGRYQSESFFEPNKGLIKELFSLDSVHSNICKETIYNQIKNSKNSISLHVRRGDYLNEYFSSKIGILDKEYYYDSVSFLREKYSKETTIFVFSDDIEWCEENFKIDNCIFVRQEKTKEGFFKDLYLMTLCKHHIISNSTFSWWGAWLGESDDGIVLAPENWAKTEEFFPKRILPNRWIKMNNRLL